MDVNSLQNELGTSHSSVSQNLAVLRAHKLVAERREGRRVIYRLINPELAAWLLQGIGFLEDRLAGAEVMRNAVASVKGSWSKPDEPAES